MSSWPPARLLVLPSILPFPPTPVHLHSCSCRRSRLVFPYDTMADVRHVSRLFLSSSIMGAPTYKTRRMLLQASACLAPLICILPLFCRLLFRGGQHMCATMPACICVLCWPRMHTGNARGFMPGVCACEQGREQPEKLCQTKAGLGLGGAGGGPGSVRPAHNPGRYPLPGRHCPAVPQEVRYPGTATAAVPHLHPG